MHIIEVVPILLRLGSPRGGLLVNQHDAHILFSHHTAHSVPRHAPHDAPHELPLVTYLSIARDLARGVSRVGPRDQPHVDFRVDHGGVPRRLPKTHACTKQDDAAAHTAYRTTNSSDSERAQKSDLDCIPTAYCAMLNIAILTSVGDALFPSSIVVRLE